MSQISEYDLMLSLCDYYNNCEDFDVFYFENKCQEYGFISDCSQPFGLCHGFIYRLVINSDGLSAEIVRK